MAALAACAGNALADTSAVAREAGSPSHAIPLALAASESQSVHTLIGASLPAHAAGAMALTVPMSQDPPTGAVYDLGMQGGGLSALTAPVRTYGSDEEGIANPLREAPFPTGVGMGMVGLAMVMAVTAVRRHRLSIM